MRHQALLLSCVLLIASRAHGQFHHLITSEPDSAAVFLNGTKRCNTPCVLKYRWKDAVDGHLLIEVKEDGWKTWSDTITEKPRLLDVSSKVDLQRDKPHFDLPTGIPPISFDKLVADIKDGSIVGQRTDKDGKSTPVKWEGSVKIGESTFERRTLDLLTDAGLPTVIRQQSKLFTGSKDNKPQRPRYVLGAELVEYGLNMRVDHETPKGAGRNIARTRMVCDWKVLDQGSNQVVLTVRTTGETHERAFSGHLLGNNLAAYETALIKFLNEGRFIALLQGSTDLQDTNPPDSAMTRIELARTSNPAFKNLAEMIRYADRSCVTIITDGGHGSGVIVSGLGHVISAQHVIEGVNRIEVQFSDGLRQEATVVRADPEHDLVLLDIAGSGFRPLPLDVTDSTGLGDEVVTIGTPADVILGQSISKGILSGKRKIDGKIYLQTDVAVSPGNSGGPLINAHGEVIGIIQGKLVGEAIEGLGFAIPIERVMERLRLDIGN